MSRRRSHCLNGHRRSPQNVDRWNACIPCRRARARLPEVMEQQRARVLREYRADPERARALNQTPERRAYFRAWREANPERARENIRRWREANPDRRHAELRNTKAIRRALIGPDKVSSAEQAALLEAAQGRCLYRFRCSGAPATDLDHLVPLRPRAGEPVGRHVLDNLVPACAACNRGPGGKFNLPLDVWLPPRRAAAFRTRHAKLDEHLARGGRPRKAVA